MMSIRTGWATLLLATTVAASACGSDSSAPEPEPEPEPGNLPPIPVPTSVNTLLPDRSPALVVGMSGELEWFAPLLTSLEFKRDDGSSHWVTQNRRHLLACPGVLAFYSATGSETFITARPRLQHSRYWLRLDQHTLAPGASYTHVTSVTWGASTTDTKSREFSSTIGVETSVGGSWEGFSVAVTTAYSQTSTSSQVHSVTFKQEQTQERSFSVAPPTAGTRVYALWQLVDVFTLVDASGTPIHQSPTLAHAKMGAVQPIEFVSDNVLRQNTTDFN